MKEKKEGKCILYDKCIRDCLIRYCDIDKKIARKRLLYILKCLFHTADFTNQIVKELEEREVILPIGWSGKDFLYKVN